MSDTFGLRTPSEPPLPSISTPMTFGSVPERINALEALLTVLIVKGSVFTTSAELAAVQKAVRESDDLSNTPLGREMDRLLDRLKSAVEDHESREIQDDRK